MTEKFDLDKNLIEFSDSKGASSWSIRNAVEGVQIFGGIGSGKTSGSGRLLALKFLSNHFGGLVLTTKPDEKEMWQQYCQQTNRLNDLIIIEPGGEHYFNFLDYESSKSGEIKSFSENIVQVLKTVIRASEEKSSGKGDDQFWETALDMLIFNVIDLCLLAYGKVSIQLMYDIVLTAPKKDENNDEGKKNTVKKKAFDEAFALAQKKTMQQVDAWDQAQPPERIRALVESGKLEQEICEAIPDARLLKFIDQFFIDNYRNLSEKTRSVIEFIFLGFLFRLLKEPFYSLFCQQDSTVVPEDSLNGKIILLNFPVKQYHKVGRDIQIMFKYIWQRAMEKRNVKQNERPVFLWADEAQNFIHEHDAEYQATARSSRIATVYISQNLPNYHANMGGAKSEYTVKSFLGTLATKIFHANADIETNKYSSELVGENYMEEHSRTVTTAGSLSASKSVSAKLERMVRPEEFVSLKTGGKVNQNLVEGIIHKQGNPFHNGLNFIVQKFKQS